MDIQTVKISGEGFLVNGNMSIPNAEGNRHFKMVQEWLALGNVPEPEFTADELAAQDLAIEQAWVVAELAQADKELFILEDGDPRGKADIPAWRNYRKALRNHITGVRPVRPV